MAIVEAAFEMFDRCLNVLGLIKAGQRQRNERVDQALFALYAALNETRLYIASRNAPRNFRKPRDLEREHAIARLWHNASIPLREIDLDLANRCFDKGNYWMEPDTWTDEQIRRKRIKLDQVMKSIRAILMERG